jgi:hypothetical protein
MHSRRWIRYSGVRFQLPNGPGLILYCQHLWRCRILHHILDSMLPHFSSSSECTILQLLHRMPLPGFYVARLPEQCLQEGFLCLLLSKC